MKNQITEQNFNKELTKQNGITLIALVVTIIVLLILAGVTITLVLGENGIIAKAQRAKSATDEASAKEAVELAVGYVQAEAYTNNLTQEEIRAALQEELQKTDANATVSINGEGYTATYKGYEFEIDSNFNVTIKQPFNAAEWDKTAAPETCFQWGSDNPEDENYHTIVGWTEEIQTLVKVRIPSRCTKIIVDGEITGNYNSEGRAFVQNIQTVELPETIIEIGAHAFGSPGNLSFKSMTEINIPNGCKNIGNFAFHGCTSLTNIIIPNSVKSIGSSAFYGCTSLTSITIPDSVTYISSSAFHNTAWYNNQPNGLVYAGKVAYKYKGTMPSNTSVEIKEGTKVIEDYAFYNCTGLTSITIPNSVTSIKSGAFYGCTSLTSITIPDSVTSIGNIAFSGCTSLTSIIISDSVTYIGGDAFHNTAWYNNQPDGLVYAGKVAYDYKGTMPSNTSVEIKEGTKGIAGRAFYRQEGLISITIPNSVTNIGADAFGSCYNLASVSMSKNVISIGDAAFAYCTKLSNIVIWKNVDELGYRTFDDWTGSQTVNIEASEVPDGWDRNWNYGCNANIVWGYTGD